MRRCIPRLLTSFVVLLLATPALAQRELPLFADHATLNVTLEAPLNDVFRQRDSDEYHDGKLRFIDAGGELRELDIKLRARGRYRKRTSTCGFPPIRLNFKKKQVQESLFAGQDKLKLVTHCRDNSERYEQLLLREYLAYRLWQSMTNYGFGVRLLRIDWVDSDNPQETRQRFGFLLEDEELLGERLGFEPSEIRSVKPEELIADQAALLGVFEYMIANTDFSMLLGPAEEVCCHNVVLYKTPAGHLPIPYDFDFSGIVNAPYAEPNPKFKIRSVRTRLYRGRCEHNGALAAAIEAFQAKRQVLYDLVESQPGMTSGTRKSVRKFLDGFYKVIDNPKRVHSRLVRKCV